MLVSRGELSSFLSRFPEFENITISPVFGPKMPASVVKEMKEIIAYGRKFNDEVVRPATLNVDRKTHEDHDFVAYYLADIANEWGFYTMFIPKLFGGKGMSLPAFAYLGEEIATLDAGMATVIGAHYLGYAALVSSGNVPLINRISREVAEGERTGKRCILALSITEPSAGTDTEEVELTCKARIDVRAEKVKGGYIVNGNKIFVTSGHMASWITLHCFLDPKRPHETFIGFMLDIKNTKGFHFGKHEDKMGQRTSPASELVFEDAFIPDDLVLYTPETFTKYTNKSAIEIYQRYIDYIVCLSRPVIGALGVGVARGAFEETVKFAAANTIDGQPLINYSWVQTKLAEMYKNALLGRLAYAEAEWANCDYGLNKILMIKFMYYFLKYVPKAYFDYIMSPLLNLGLANWLWNKWFFDWHTLKADHIASGWCSLAKFVGGDAGIRNCQMALEIMGQFGMRQENLVEKLLRDGKLIQIYEGSNELNRLNVFKCLIAQAVPNAKLFEE